MDGYERVHGGNGFADRKAQGEAILEFATCFNLVANTFFTKEMQKLVKYELGEVISGEDCVSQQAGCDGYKY